VKGPLAYEDDNLQKNSPQQLFVEECVEGQFAKNSPQQLFVEGCVEGQFQKKHPSTALFCRHAKQ
jgi:hypothetical protein